MWLISVTRDTSHFQMSPLNDAALMKTELISVTLDTSHCLIDPYGLYEQSPPANLRQLATALLSCALDSGENKDWPSQEFGDVDIRRIKKTA